MVSLLSNEKHKKMPFFHYYWGSRLGSKDKETIIYFELDMKY